MSEKMPQTRENHAKVVPGFHYVLALLILVPLGYQIWQLFKSPDPVPVAMQIVLILAIALQYWYVRTFPLTVQDRLIRLEEQLRYQRVLPADLLARAGELKRGQFVALRFAPDEELPGLVRRVLAGELKNNKEIKQAIQNWRPDYLRA